MAEVYKKWSEDITELLFKDQMYLVISIDREETLPRVEICNEVVLRGRAIKYQHNGGRIEALRAYRFSVEDQNISLTKLSDEELKLISA